MNKTLLIEYNQIRLCIKIIDILDLINNEQNKYLDITF